jgi:hypothetical protein
MFPYLFSPAAIGMTGQKSQRAVAGPLGPSLRVKGLPNGWRSPTELRKVAVRGIGEQTLEAEVSQARGQGDYATK